MRLRISAFLAALGLVLLGASASAIAKPAVAVLGVEVIDNGTGIDAKTTELAKLLTDALRKRAELSSSPYDLAPNSEKDLLEMKLLSGCADEARACMANIGRELNADRLVYGKVERRDTGYQVSLKLLNVETKAMERSTSDVVPFADNNPPAINNKWSRVLFNRLTGIPEQGNLVVEANVSQGSVYVDGEVATGLNNGRAQVTGLSEGAHTVAVEADGHERYETEVTVTAGQTTEIDARLQALAAVQSPGNTEVGGGPGTVTGGGSARPRAKAERPGGTARVLFWTTVVTTAAGGTAALITGLKVRKLQADKKDLIKGNGDYTDRMRYQFPSDFETGQEVDVCGNAEDSTYLGNNEAVDELDSICKDGEKWGMVTSAILGATAVSAAAALYFGYTGYYKETPSERRSARAGDGEPDDALVRFAPTITPNYLGAGLTIEF